MVLVLSLTVLVSVALATSVSVFFTDFDSGAPSEFSGITTTEGVQGYAGFGTAPNFFGGDFLRNTTGDNFGGGSPPEKTILTLTGLPSHTSISLSFLLAIIDSWDGVACSEGPDLFNVTVDSVLIFSAVFDNSGCGAQTFIEFPGVLLVRRLDLGFNATSPSLHRDSAWDLGMDPTFSNIPHTSSTLTIEWFASGAGWQGGTDESWAIDNVEVILNTVVVTVDIDIKPGSDPNSINTKSKGVVPVAILGSATFDVNSVDATASILFGPCSNEGASPKHELTDAVVRSDHTQDVASPGQGGPDGIDDLVIHFPQRDTNLTTADTVGCLEALTTGGAPIQGSDNVNVVK